MAPPHCEHCWLFKGPSKAPPQPLSPAQFPTCTYCCTVPPKLVRWEPRNAILPSISTSLFLKLKYNHVMSSLFPMPPIPLPLSNTQLSFFFAIVAYRQMQPAQPILCYLLSLWFQGGAHPRSPFSCSQHSLVACSSLSMRFLLSTLACLSMLYLFRSCLGSHNIKVSWVKLPCHFCEIS